MRTNFSRLFILIGLVACSSPALRAPSSSSSPSSTKSLGAFFLNEMMGTDVLLFGELHDSINHRLAEEEILRPLLEKKVIQAIAVEWIADFQNDLLQKYLSDSAASEGSPEEKRHLTGMADVGFPTAHESFARTFRLLKVAANNGVRVCGFNFDDLTHHPANLYYSVRDTPEQNLKSFANLPEGYRKLGRKMYGPAVSNKKLSAKPNGDAITGVIRELWMAANIESCFSGAAKAVAIMGANHAASFRPQYATVRDLLVERMPGRRIASVEMGMFNLDEFTERGLGAEEYAEGFSWRNPKFHEKHRFENFVAIDLRKSGGPKVVEDLYVKIHSKKFPASRFIDFLVLGPPSENVRK